VALEDLLQQVVVEGREDVEQLDAVFGGLRPVLIRDLITSTRSPCSSWWIVAVIEQMSMMPNSRPRSRSQLDDGRDAVQAVGDHVDAAKEVRPGASILLTKQMRGTCVLVGLAPDRLGLGLDAGDGVKDRDRGRRGRAGSARPRP